jgi:hypothetical protein
MDPEHLAKLARVPVHTAAAKEQERDRIAGTQLQLTILGEQNPILAGTEFDQLAVRPSALGKKGCRSRRRGATAQVRPASCHIEAAWRWLSGPWRVLTGPLGRWLRGD